jgi:hypothetical protein
LLRAAVITYDVRSLKGGIMKKHSLKFFPMILCLVAFVGTAATRTSPAAGQAPSVTLQPDLSIGVEDGDENLMFGSISRIDIDGKGNIYIFDYKFRKVVMCGPDGQFLRSFLVNFMISSIGCAGTEDLVAIGPNGGKILHVFDQSGKLLASFGDTFTPPAELEQMKEMPMFGAPILFNCSKDGRIFILNPHRYEISVFKDGRLDQVLKGKSELFKPIQQRGRGFFSTAAHVVKSGDLVFVCFQNPDPSVKKTADVFQAGKQVGAMGLPGTPYVSDPQGRIYFVEAEDFPKVVRYAVVNN